MKFLSHPTVFQHTTVITQNYTTACCLPTVIAQTKQHLIPQMGVCVREKDNLGASQNKNRLLGQIVQTALRPSAHTKIITHYTDLSVYTV